MPIFSRSLFFLAMISLYIFAIRLQSSIFINGDISWLMNATQRMLAGGTYLNDFFEINTPFILYLYIPPVFFAHYFSLLNSSAAQGYTFILATVSIFMSYFLIKKIFSFQHSREIYLFTFALAFVLLIFPIHEFGQREHLMLIFSMPYLFLIVYRLQDNRVNPYLAGWIGVFAALGFAIKPFFLFTPLFVELYYSFVKRSYWAWLRPEILAIGVVFLIYMALILFFHSDYLFIVLPFAMRLYHTTYGTSFSSALLYDPELFSGFAIILYLVFYPTNPYKILSNVLLLALIGFLLTYIVQHNLLYYHVLPVFSLAILMFALFFILSLSKKWEKKQILFMSISGLFCLSFLLLFEKSSALLLLIFHPLAFNIFFGILFCLMLYTAQKNKNIFFVLIYVAFTLITSQIFSYVVQHTSWYAYQLSFTMLLMALLISVYFVNLKQYYYIFITLFGIAIFSYPFCILNTLYWRTITYRKKAEKIANFMQENAPHQTVYFFTTRTDLEYPAADYANVKSVSRFASLGWLYGLSTYSSSLTKNLSSSQLTTTRDFFVNMTIDDFNRHKPFLVFVDVNNYDAYINGFTFNYLGFYLRYPKFQAIWKHYHYVTTIKDNPLFKLQVYQRDNA